MQFEIQKATIVWKQEIHHKATINSSCVRNVSGLQSNRAYIAERFSRKAFAITETELKLIAAAAIMGLSSKPKNG